VRPLDEVYNDFMAKRRTAVVTAEIGRGAVVTSPVDAIEWDKLYGVEDIPEFPDCAHAMHLRDCGFCRAVVTGWIEQYLPYRPWPPRW
jgi:hypothetical protein